MKVLVTGGSGFIGTHLVERLLERGSHVVILDLRPSPVEHSHLRVVQGDLLDRGYLARAMSGVDAIYHLAANVSVPLCEEQPIESTAVNLLGTVRILEAVREAHSPQSKTPSSKIPPIIFASSSAVYGRLGESLTHLTENGPGIRPISLYGWQKLGSEQMLERYHRAFGIPTLAFRFFNVYGPGQAADSPYSGVISLFSRKIQEHQPLLLHDGGMQTRDFIFVSDIVDALVRPLDLTPEQYAGLSINLGTERPLSIRDLAKALLESAGISDDVEERLIGAPKREGDISASCANSQLASRILGWKARVDLQSGIKHLYDSMNR